MQTSPHVSQKTSQILLRIDYVCYCTPYSFTKTHVSRLVPEALTIGSKYSLQKGSRSILNSFDASTKIRAVNQLNHNASRVSSEGSRRGMRAIPIDPDLSNSSSILPVGWLRSARYVYTKLWSLCSPTSVARDTNDLGLVFVRGRPTKGRTLGGISRKKRSAVSGPQRALKASYILASCLWISAANSWQRSSPDSRIR